MPKFGIDQNWFCQIITAYELDDPAHAKPHPYSGLTILETQKIRANEAIMVGDTVTMC
jgi:phosphoglycolate phosphatase-like HAD superfamily hydrolase